jgi:hypothetical protein
MYLQEEEEVVVVVGWLWIQYHSLEEVEEVEEELNLS